MQHGGVGVGHQNQIRDIVVAVTADAGQAQGIGPGKPDLNRIAEEIFQRDKGPVLGAAGVGTDKRAQGGARLIGGRHRGRSEAFHQHDRVVSKAGHARINGVSHVAHAAGVILPFAVLDVTQVVILKTVSGEVVMVLVGAIFHLGQITGTINVVGAARVVFKIINAIAPEQPLVSLVRLRGQEIINPAAGTVIVILSLDVKIVGAGQPGVEGKVVGRDVAVGIAGRDDPGVGDVVL